jgi:hypothetical protein
VETQYEAGMESAKLTVTDYVTTILGGTIAGAKSGYQTGSWLDDYITPAAQRQQYYTGPKYKGTTGAIYFDSPV